MKHPLLADIERRLGDLEKNDLRRTLSVRAEGLVDFASNDYLGLSRHPHIRGALARSFEALDLFAPASRQLGGTTRHHEALEARLARFKGAEAALLFPSGYQANLALLSTLIRPHDVVFSDALNHASLIDGLRLSRADKRIFAHADADALRSLLRAAAAEKSAGAQLFIVTESLFSMDGDIAPLAEYAALAADFGAALLVDEAHATGLYGPHGEGIVAERNLTAEVFAATSTCGKAFGTSGAFVTGPQALIDLIVSTGRPFLFSTALSPLQAIAISAGLDVITNEPEHRHRLRERTVALTTALGRHGIRPLPSAGPIVPVVIGGSSEALRVAAEVRHAGYDVRAVRPPTVPEGTARLRITVHADHTPSEIEGLAAALGKAVRLDVTAPHQEG